MHKNATHIKFCIRYTNEHALICQNYLWWLIYAKVLFSDIKPIMRKHKDLVTFLYFRNFGTRSELTFKFDFLPPSKMHFFLFYLPESETKKIMEHHTKYRIPVYAGQGA
jgi:hypothetical protein